MKPEAVDAARSYFYELLEILGETGQIDVFRETERELGLNLQGIQTFAEADPQTLRSLGYLAEIALRRQHGERVHIELDVNGRRKAQLTELRANARAWAQDARQRHRKVELDPMAAFERKAIHEALSDFSDVKTYSVGRGNRRRIVIEPVRSSSSADSSDDGSQTD